MWYNKVVVIKFLAVKRDIFWRDFPGIQTGITVIGKAYIRIIFQQFGNRAISCQAAGNFVGINNLRTHRLAGGGCSGNAANLLI